MSVIDEAWVRRGLPVPGDMGRYEIDMGRPVGLAGEEKVVIIVRDSNRVITSFPIK
jgi:filamentous hemagglutinin